jgi:adenosylcobinamide-GDP ribazoletransferase
VLASAGRFESRAAVNPLWIALGFLSRFPIRAAAFNDRDAARSVFWFPGVGILIGIAVALVELTRPVWGDDVAAFVALGTWVWVTGALHLDGLADTCDGFSASNAGKDRARSAMKDSRIGAHGACALVLVLFGKWVLLRRCIEVNAFAPSVVTAAVVARLNVGFLLAWAVPATHSGLGALFARELKTRRRVVWCATAWTVVLPVGFWLFLHLEWQLTVKALVVSILLTACLSFLLARRCKACFGGVTGDTHGASIELVELAVLAVHAAMFGVVSA